MADEIVIRSGLAQARLLPERGGLLRSLRLAEPRLGAVEVLYEPQGFDPAGSEWPGGGMAVLFPFAGRVWAEGVEGRYRLDEQEYELPIHGLAWQSAWVVDGARTLEDQAVLQLASTAASLRRFPFHFLLVATYRLSESALSVGLRIENQDRGPMPIAVGLHPYFRFPVRAAAGEDADLADTRPWRAGQLRCAARTMVAVTPEGAAGDARAAAGHDDSYSFAEADPADPGGGWLRSCIFADLWEPWVRLEDPLGGRAVEVNWRESGERFRYVVTWADCGEGYFCAEPWMGLPDAIHSGRGLEWVAPETTTELSVEICLVELQSPKVDGPEVLAFA